MAESGQGVMPRIDFKNMIEAKKTVETTAGRGGIIYRVWELLKRNAMTLEALSENLGVGKRTVTNAIAHLKQRKNLDIQRHFNKLDGKFYYYLGQAKK